VFQFASRLSWWEFYQVIRQILDRHCSSALILLEGTVFCCSVLINHGTNQEKRRQFKSKSMENAIMELML